MSTLPTWSPWVCDDRHPLDVGGLDADLGELRGELSGAGSRADRGGHGLVGDGIGVAGVPQQPLLAVADQVAVVGELDRLATLTPGDQRAWSSAALWPQSIT
jgi:hypothetical protein